MPQRYDFFCKYARDKVFLYSKNALLISAFKWFNIIVIREQLLVQQASIHHFLIGSQVSSIPSLRKILRSTSESITVEWT